MRVRVAAALAPFIAAAVGCFDHGSDGLEITLVASNPQPYVGERMAFRADLTSTEDDSAVEWDWLLVSAPDGSTGFLDTVVYETAYLTPDVPGTYVVQVRGVLDPDPWDDVPGRSGEASSFTQAISYGSVGRLAAQLAWSTSANDVDLHLVHESAGGYFFSSKYDCHFRNSHPEWGLPSTTFDDPLLDIDDVNGFGPENIVIPGAEAAIYHVFVHYFDDKGVGPTTATLRLWRDEALLYEASHVLATKDIVWDVVEFDASLGVVTAIDATFLHTTFAPIAKP